MSTRGIVVRVLVLLLVGAIIGGVLGAIFTGDWIYTIVWCVALTLVLVVMPIVATRSTRQRILTAPGRVPGIINSRLQRPVPTEAVLNPPPTAVPSTGATLNGMPVATTAETPALGRTRSGSARSWNRGLAIVIVLVGIVLTLLPSYRLIGWTVGNIAQGRWDGNDMRSGLHQQEAVDDLARVIGSYDFVAVNFYDSYVLIEAPTYPGATTTDQYQWRYGRAERDGPYSGVVDGVFDGSQVDFSLVGDVVAQAKADAGWSDFTYYYPAVRENSEGQVQITVSLGNDYYAASYTFSSEGQFIQRNGTGLD